MVRATRLVIVSLAVIAATGTAVATADAPTITGFPNGIRKVDLAGYQLVASYPLGAIAGSTFEQTYLPGGKVSFRALPPTGPVFSSNYVAMPVGNKQLMVTWYLDNGTLRRLRHELQDRNRLQCRPGPEPWKPGLAEDHSEGFEQDSAPVVSGRPTRAPARWAARA